MSINPSIFESGYRFLGLDRSVLATAEARGGAASMTDADGAVLATLHQHSKWRRWAPVSISVAGGPIATLARASRSGSDAELWLGEDLLARIDRGPRRRSYVALSQTGVDVAHLQARQGELHLWRRPGLGEPGRSLLTLLPWAMLVFYDDFVPRPHF